eukprot:m.365014 g.365014  ORF g.365014 m.365014 type:complete len:961 (-) comp20810_c0_seq1:290-3172(-)
MFAQLNRVGGHDLSGKKDAHNVMKSEKRMSSECEQIKENIPGPCAQQLNRCSNSSESSIGDQQNLVCPQAPDQKVPASDQWSPRTMGGIPTLSKKVRGMRLATENSTSWLQGFEDQLLQSASLDKMNPMDLPTSPLSPAICADLMISPASAAQIQAGKHGNVDDELLKHVRTMGEALDEVAMGAAWYLPCAVTTADIEKVLEQYVGTDGAFIVHSCEGTAMVLSYTMSGKVLHTTIEFHQEVTTPSDENAPATVLSGLCIDGDVEVDPFDSLSELITYYSENTSRGNPTLPCRLKVVFDSRPVVGNTRPLSYTPGSYQMNNSNKLPGTFRLHNVPEELLDGATTLPDDVCVDAVFFADEHLLAGVNRRSTGGPALSYTGATTQHDAGDAYGMRSPPRESSSDDAPIKAGGVKWDEEALDSVKHELDMSRGIYMCVDAAAKEAPYFLGQIFNCEAEDILRNCAIGSFVVYDDKTDLHCLHLAYVHDGGKIERRGIRYLQQERLIELDGEAKSKTYRPGVRKATLSALIATCCGRDSPLKAALYMPAPGEIVGEPWMHPRMTREQATDALEGEVPGTFVVRGSTRPGNVHVITYIYGGTAHHAPIEATGSKKRRKLKLRGSKRSFKTLCELVAFYTTSTNNDLLATLRVPQDPLLRTGLYNRPPWLRPGVPKDVVLSLLNPEVDGSFIIRTSESEKDGLVLSYVYRGVVNHERIRTNTEFDPLMAMGRRGGKSTLSKFAGGRLTSNGADDPCKFWLESMRDNRFASLDALVLHHLHRGRGLRCPLVKHAMLAPNTSTLRRVSLLHRRHTPGNRAGVSLTGGRQSSQGSLLSARSDGSYGAPSKLFGRGTNDPVNVPREIQEHPFVDPSALSQPWFGLHLQKYEALDKLPKSREGTFIVRPNPQHFATLSLVVSGKIFNVHILEADDGLHVKRSNEVYPNLSSLIDNYLLHTQQDLPRHLVLW